MQYLFRSRPAMLLAALALLMGVTASTCGPTSSSVIGGKRVNIRVKLGETTLQDIERRVENIPGIQPTEVSPNEATITMDFAEIYLTMSPEAQRVTSITLAKTGGSVGTVPIGVEGFFFDDPKEDFDRLLGPGTPVSDTETTYKGNAPNTEWDIVWGAIQNAMTITYRMRQ